MKDDRALEIMIEVSCSSNFGRWCDSWDEAEDLTELHIDKMDQLWYLCRYCAHVLEPMVEKELPDIKIRTYRLVTGDYDIPSIIPVATSEDFFNGSLKSVNTQLDAWRQNWAELVTCMYPNDWRKRLQIRNVIFVSREEFELV